MRKSSDAKSDPAPNKDSQSAPKLTLVISSPAQKSTASSKPPRPTVGFFAETYSKGDEVYEMVAQDPSHYLKCVLKLEVMESYCEAHKGGVICHFPTIEDEEFNTFVGGDETLYGILLIQFHMKVMEELLMFCGGYDASRLIIYADDAQAKQLGIYENILVHQDQIILRDLGEKTVLVIPAHFDIFDKWVDFMEDASQRLQQVLWLEQNFNPLVRAYLKSQQAIH